MSVQKKVPGATTSAGPAISVFGGQNPQIFLAWKNASDNTVWWSAYDNGNWLQPPSQVQASTSAGVAPVLTSAGPALGTYYDQQGDPFLILAWQDESDQTIWCSRYNVETGGVWTAPVSVTANGGEPSLSTIISTGYTIITWKGGADNTVRWATSSPDSEFGEWTSGQIQTAQTSSRPTVFIGDGGGGTLAWKGVADKTIWASSLSSDLAWLPQARVKDGARTTVGPAVGASDLGFFLAWKGESDNAIWWSGSADGANWGPQNQIPLVATKAEPAMAGDSKHGGPIYLAWKGESDGAIWWSASADGVTWSI
jgi:hypothetical protein